MQLNPSEDADIRSEIAGEYRDGNKQRTNRKSRSGHVLSPLAILPSPQSPAFEIGIVIDVFDYRHEAFRCCLTGSVAVAAVNEADDVQQQMILPTERR